MEIQGFDLTIIFLIVNGIFLLFFITITLLVLYYILKNLSVISCLWGNQLIMQLSGFIIFISAFLEAKNNKSINFFSSFNIFIIITVQLLIDLITIGFLAYKGKGGKINFCRKNSNRKFLIGFLLLFAAVVAILGIFTINKIRKSYFNYVFSINFVLIIILAKFVFDLARKVPYFSTKIQFLIKSVTLNCFLNTVMIIFSSINFYEEIFIELFIVFMSIICYKNIQIRMKIDFYQFIEEGVLNHIFKEMSFISRIFILEDLIAKYDQNDICDEQNEVKQICPEELNIEFNKTKEFFFLNFVFLHEIYLSKPKKVSKPASYIIEERKENNRLEESDNNKDLIEYDLWNLMNTYFESSSISIEQFQYRYKEKIEIGEKIKIECFQTEKFSELNSHFNLNNQVIIESTLPKKNTQVCKTLEINLIETPNLNNFSSYDCFISYEIYPSNPDKIKQINHFLLEYFIHITSTEFSFLPIILGAFTINFLNQEYILILYRNPIAFSVFYDMKDSFMMTFDSLKKEVHYSSKKEVGLISDFNEIYLIDEFSLDDDDLSHLKEVLNSDIDFILLNEGCSFKIDLFIINDTSVQSQERNRKSENKGSCRFDHSFLDKISFLDQGSHILTPATMTNLEEIFVLNNLGGKSRYIMKMTISNLFAEIEPKNASNYTKLIQKNLFGYIRERSKQFLFRSGISNIPRSFNKPTFIL